MFKKCTKCKEEKELESFIKDKRKKTGFGSICKPCENKQKIKYLDGKREQVREYNRIKYYENHDKNRSLKTERSRIKRLEDNEWIRNYRKEWYKRHADKLRENQRIKGKDPGFKEKRNKSLRENKKEIDIPKIRARKILQMAVKVGHMTRPTSCENCMKECKPDGHHDDYNKPLEVRWLCKICHAHVHGKLLDKQP